MGFVHSVEGPPPAPEVASALPRLSDREVLQTVALSDAYREIRRALLALSGSSLLRNVGTASHSSLGGILSAARDALDRATGALATAGLCDRPGIRSRMRALNRAKTILGDAVDDLRRDPYTDLDTRALLTVRNLLAIAELPEAGLRRFTSVSCAGYHPHDHTHGDAHGHQHHHEHESNNIH